MSASNHFSIGALAKRTGCKVQTIRYYEHIGLMPEPGRTVGNQRVYGQTHADRLAFIRHGREIGFPLNSIRELLALADRPDHSCSAADRIARAQLKAVESRISRLKALRQELRRMIEECGQGRIADCRVIEVLADHSHAHCLQPRHGAEATLKPWMTGTRPAGRPGHND